jgi:ketosteroid isomerase-like protein
MNNRPQEVPDVKARQHQTLFPITIIFAFCLSTASADQLVTDTIPAAQAELRATVMSIANDIMTSNIEGLQAAHLVSDKFTKFGPRKFERQGLDDANASEAAFFSSINDVDYSINDLKIDVFGDIGIVTYYPQVSFIKEGASKMVDGRQTFVFLRTSDGWKIVHEHGTIRN